MAAVARTTLVNRPKGLGSSIRALRPCSKALRPRETNAFPKARGPYNPGINIEIRCKRAGLGPARVYYDPIAGSKGPSGPPAKRSSHQFTYVHRAPDRPSRAVTRISSHLLRRAYLVLKDAFALLPLAGRLGKAALPQGGPMDTNVLRTLVTSLGL